MSKMFDYSDVLKTGFLNVQTFENPKEIKGQKGDDSMDCKKAETLLDLYRDRSVKQIEKKYEIDKQELYEKDKIFKDIKNVEDKINNEITNLYEKYKDILGTASVYSLPKHITRETEIKKDELLKKRFETINDLDELLKEIKARLQLSETGDDIVDVLQIYGILDCESMLAI